VVFMLHTKTFIFWVFLWEKKRMDSVIKDESGTCVYNLDEK